MENKRYVKLFLYGNIVGIFFRVVLVFYWLKKS